jgi:glycosyltransferase involved in cell wall biosynthesis
MKWICCQLGAREHYAIPRALLSRRLLGCLLTDAWVPPSSVLAKISAGSLADRFHRELSDAPVIAFNSSVILFEMLARARRLAEWERIIARNQWFQRRVVSYLRSQLRKGAWLPRSFTLSTINYQPILLSYSYAALEPFRFAKLHGWKTLLLQIDPGPEEERIVAEEVARVPALAGEWQAAPADYWASWRQECDLADRIIVNSEWSREGLMRSGVSSDKLAVIRLAYEPGVYSGRLTEPRLQRRYPDRFTQERPLRVLFLGQVNLRKGVARLLEAARILRDEPVEFWMVGPVQVANGETAADNVRVKWFGPVTRKETAEKYRAADVFILPTLSDGFAITQLEAQAYGLPVISSKCCGGVVENGRNGMILEEPSAACIAAAIRDCVADPNRLQTLAAASYVQNEFTTDVLGDRLQNLGSKV